MDKKSPDVRYICRISGWDFKHLAVRGWFRHLHITILHLMEMDSFNHLSVRGWFRLIKKAVFGDVIGY